MDPVVQEICRCKSPEDVSPHGLFKFQAWAKSADAELMKLRAENIQLQAAAVAKKKATV